MSQTESSPNSNSSNHSGRDTPCSKSLSYSAHNNKKQLSNKRFPPDETTRGPSKKHENKTMRKDEGIHVQIRNESSSENSDYDESNSERDDEKGLKFNTGSRYLTDDDADEEVSI